MTQDMTSLTGSAVGGLTEAKGYYKPFRYPWAFNAYQLQKKMDWVPEEVPLGDDVRDFKTNITPGGAKPAHAAVPILHDR